MDVGAEFRRCLEELDAPGVRRLWSHVSPHLPAPASDAEALKSLHMARTASVAMALKLRAYSHRWLLDRGLPSLLPDHLKPSAERLYPSVVEAVGISVNFTSSVLRQLEPIVRKPMEDAVEDAFANGDGKDSELVRRRMTEAKDREMRALFGRLSAPA